MNIDRPHVGSVHDLGQRRPRLGGSIAVGAAVLALGFLATASLSHASSPTSESVTSRLAYALSIREDLHARMRLLPGAKLRLADPTPTDVLESFVLLSPDLLGQRTLPASGGIWYSICPRTGPCAAPARRLTRPASDVAVHRLALELAARTFLETDAPLVAISLPTPDIVAVVFERSELARDVDLRSLAVALRKAPVRGSRADAIEAQVAELTRPRTYLHLGLEPAPNGGTSWGGMPRWPLVSW
jgi:hypothetical protein